MTSISTQCPYLSKKNEVKVEQKTTPYKPIPGLIGIGQGLLNIGEFNRFPSQFHVVRHMMNLITDQTNNRAGILDLVKEVYSIAKAIFRTTPRRYFDKEPTNCGLVDLSQPFHPCPILNYDFCLLIKMLHITGVFDAKMIREVLHVNRQKDGYPITVSKNYAAIGMLTDPSIEDGRTPFTAKNERYQVLRTFLRKNLLTTKLHAKEEFASQLHDLTHEVINKVEESKDGIIEDISDTTFLLPSKVIQCLLFGKVIPGVQEKMYKMLLMIRDIIGTLGSESKANKLKQSEDFLFLKELMGKILENPAEYPGLLSQMAKETNSEGVNQFDQDDLFAILLFFLTAGEDTLTSAITSSLYELGRHPKIQEELYECLLPFYEKNEIIDLETLDRIPKLDWVVKEILRLYPALPILVRDINQQRPDKEMPVTLRSPEGEGEYALEDQRALWLYVYESNRDPKYWRHPEQFIPERWDKKRAEEFHTQRGNYLSFGIGPNRCVGENLARIELKALIYYFIKTYKFTTRKEVFFQTAISLSPGLPVSIQVEKRE